MRNAFQSLSVSLDRIRDIANELIATAPQALAESAIRTRHETMQAGSIVLLSGYLESFLKATAQEFIDNLCQRQPPFTSLPASVRHAHFEEGGEVLSRAAAAQRKNRTTWIRSTPLDIARRLHSTNTTSYELVWEAFADTRSNPNAEVVREFINRFGIKKAWERIEAKTKAKVGHMTATAMVAGIDNIVLTRNECAHTGTAALLPSPSDLLSHCDLIAAIAEGVVEVLEDHLTAVAPPPAPVPPAPAAPPPTAGGGS